ncbi:hypothetical protein DVH24_036673 [Malus domestica]|uniref:Uncharacterized protein n=1 Tax=Malus domestica TaxID=3750 RepID=A0A498IK31_MALDO|nr:hypothetical protein DVH24_036673 [Malus domestica]
MNYEAMLVQQRLYLEPKAWLSRVIYKFVICDSRSSPQLPSSNSHRTLQRIEQKQSPTLSTTLPAAECHN